MRDVFIKDRSCRSVFGKVVPFLPLSDTIIFFFFFYSSLLSWNLFTLQSFLCIFLSSTLIFLVLYLTTFFYEISFKRSHETLRERWKTSFDRGRPWNPIKLSTKPYPTGRCSSIEFKFKHTYPILINPIYFK